MAAAIATPTPNSSLPTGKGGGDGYRSFGSIAISASPATYTTNGIPLSFMQAGIKAQRTPLTVSVGGKAGYIFVYIAGTDASNGKLKVFVQDAVATNPLAEMADALAIPAGLSGDTIGYTALWLGME